MMVEPSIANDCDRLPSAMPSVTEAVRGYCEATKPRAKTRHRKKAPLPHVALVFDTETTIDAAQRLTFGAYALHERDGANEWYRDEPAERGLFFADGPGVPSDIATRLRLFANSIDPRLVVHSQIEFLELFHEIAYRQRGLVVAFNMPWDISRIARDAGLARGKAKGGFSFLFWPKWTRHGEVVRDATGNMEGQPFRPRITVKSLGPKKASIRFTHTRTAPEADDVVRSVRRKASRIERGYVAAPWLTKDDENLGFNDRWARAMLAVPKDERKDVEAAILSQYLETHGRYKGRLLDIAVLGKALTDTSHSLESACKAYGVKPKGVAQDGHRGWDFDADYVRYNLNDVTSTGELMNAMLREYARHPIDLEPDRAFSSASLGKAYIRAMGVAPPLERSVDFPRDLLGIAQAAFYGGRTNIGIRRAIVPVTYLDFLSMYPTVNALLGTIDLLRATSMGVVDATDEVQSFLDSIAYEDAFDPQTWKRLTFFALVERDGTSVLPVRATFGKGDAANIGMVHVTGEAAWHAGPDVLASFVMTGNRPRIARAYRIEPARRPDGTVDALESLRAIDFMGATSIDPRSDDVFSRIIEQRQTVRTNEALSADERERVQKGLKVIANATSYGIYAETNVTDESEPIDVRVHCGGESFEIFTDAPELPGLYSFPPISSLITAGAHLMLALLEHEMRVRGGTSALEDTDSMAIVATRDGGIVPCPNGPEAWEAPLGCHGPHANESRGVRALSWADVAAIVARFVSLSPYDRNIVPGSILKVEDINYGPGNVDGSSRSQRQLYAYAVSSKRYALFELDGDGAPRLDFTLADDTTKSQYTESGLGAIVNPIVGEKGKGWIKDFWRLIVSGELGLPIAAPEWFTQPVIAQMPVSAPATWAAFDLYNAPRAYDESVSPFGFGLTARLEQGLRRSSAPANMSDRDWKRHVETTGARIREETLSQFEPYHRALAHIGGTIVPATFKGRERSEYTDVLSRYKERDPACPDGTLDLFVQALQTELPGATEDDALAFLRNPRTTMTWKQARTQAERELRAFAPLAGREQKKRPRLFAPRCESEAWLAQGDASPWFDIHTGARVDIVVNADPADPYETRVRVVDFANLANVYGLHPEPKGACADGAPCDDLAITYRGPLSRRSIRVAPGADIVGKEAQHFEDEVATALGELVEDSEGTLGVFRSASPQVEQTLLEGLSSRAVAKRARTTDAMVAAVRDGRAPASSPDVNRVRRAARALATSPPCRVAILALGRKRLRAETERVTADTLDTLRASEAPYWAALKRAGGRIVPDVQRVFGTWRVNAEFDGLAPRLLQRDASLTSRATAGVIRGNLDAIVEDLCATGVTATRASVLAWFREHPRPASRAEARRDADTLVKAACSQRLEEALGA